MGIESDQVVYEYLSRVGDVAQQRQLSSATRMRLVSELRNEIDRRRAKAPVDSPAAVRRILDRLGSPDDLVAAAADGASGTPVAPGVPSASVPVQRDGMERGEERDKETANRPRGLRRVVPRPRPSAPQPSPATPSDAASPPHRAPAHELGDGTQTPDWWRREPDPFGPGEDVPGFVGGVEIPDMLRPPRPKAAEGDPGEPGESGDGEGEGEEREPADGDAATAPRRRLLGLLRPAGRTGRTERTGGAGWSNPLLLIAACALVAGAVLGNWPALIVGWLIAYVSRRLSDRETKWAVMGLPGLAAAAGLVWLWGRGDGRWGDPIAEGQMNDAIAQTWPWVVRGAAVASALFLVWRSQRRR
ncbi:hypothetical protein OG562_19070 [Streptomyces sp. NBC_01275]|uniref:hypothetical protein n=1 Tax=Streptomyces sp. NBC_01275 TaxID=2903807 RepID=UPI002254F3BC|nr:hypothetical protein [Streptomyces sp. NBC_01275]MCX4763043.1 hypothetical protein [Streptomyces sp. NBC_01275]